MSYRLTMLPLLLTWIIGGGVKIPPGVTPAGVNDIDAATLTLPDGRVLRIDSTRFKFTGDAILEWADGRRYEGRLEHGKPHGRGTSTSATGNIYQGDFVTAFRRGSGALTTSYGERYRGQWHADRRHGSGIWEDASGSTYEGEWRDGERHGQGSSTFTDGSRHEGLWEANVPLGLGMRVLASGIRLTGIRNHDCIASGLVELPGGGEFAGALYRSRERLERLFLGWLERQASTGDPHACLLFGLAYLQYKLQYKDPPPDKHRTRYWLTLASEKGIDEAGEHLKLINHHSKEG